MATQTDLMMKTRGWKIDALTEGTAGDTTGALSVTKAMSDYYALTADGRLAWAELTSTDMTGVEVMREVLFPQGWDIQEPMFPTCWMDGKTSYTNESSAVVPGLWPEVYCYDIWSTKKVRLEDFNKMTMSGTVPMGYNTVFPGFLNQYDVNAAAMKDPYWDQEQVICGRSRNWTISNDIAESAKADSLIRKVPMALIHDNRWGLMEPIAASILHHCRIWVIAIPCQKAPATEFMATGSATDPNHGWFYNLPPSNQPMLTMRDDPGFVERMTMERRARDV